MKTLVLSVVLTATAAFSRPQPGLPFLLIWPTARSTALAGAITGLADDPDAAFFNPAGLAFQPGIGSTVNYVNWLPGLYKGMWHGYAAARLTRQPCASNWSRLGFGFEATHLSLSDIGMSYNDPGFPPSRVNTWRTGVAALGAFRPSDRIAVGLKLKYIRSHREAVYGEFDGDVYERHTGGTGSTGAADLGVLWKPSPWLSLGGSVANLGPGISYSSSGKHDPSPTVLRLGACWNALDKRWVSVRLLPELDRLLVGMLYDSTGGKPLARRLTEEFCYAWKSLAVEVTGFDVLSVRVGYFEDRAWQRGGLRYRYDMSSYHYTVYDLLTRRHLGRLESIGLCWGFGIGYKGYFRFDVSSDAAIYDFPTTNWKFALVANDIAGGIRELRQGHWPGEE